MVYKQSKKFYSMILCYFLNQATSVDSNRAKTWKSKRKPHFYSAVYLLVGVAVALIYNNKNLKKSYTCDFLRFF